MSTSSVRRLSFLRNFLPTDRTLKRTRSLRLERLEDRQLLAVLPDFYFGNFGTVTTAIESGSEANSVVVQNDGKLVLAGKSFNGSNSDFAIVRYNVDGSVDPSFDSDGIVTTAVGLTNDVAYDLAIQDDGKLVVVGNSFNGGSSEVALIRYDNDGSLDTTFGGGDGIVTTSISGQSYGRSIAIQDDGKLVVAGNSTGSDGFTSEFAIIRYNTDGSLDSSFGEGDGVVTTSIGAGGAPRSIVVQSDGKLVVAGNSSLNAKAMFTLVRYNTDGSLDATFNSTGIVTTSIGSGDSYANALAIQSDGKAVVAGYSRPDGSLTEFAVARYNVDGSLDSTFDEDGIVTAAIGSQQNEAKGIAVQSDGKLLVAGSIYNGSFHDFALLRFNTDGTPDNLFNGDGVLTTAIGSSHSQANALAIRNDGRPVVVGRSVNGSVFDFAVVQYVETKPTIIGLSVPSHGSLGKRVELSVNATDVNQDSESLSYEWHITGPNMFDAVLFGQATSFVPPADGTYLASVKVMDIEGLISTRVGSILVENTAPTISSFVVPAIADQGRRVRLSGRATDPNQANTTLAYQWTVTGPGGFQTTSSDNNFVFIPPDEGTYTANLQVEDNRGATTVAASNVVVVNEAPVITSFVVPPDANEGDRVRLSGLATDLNQLNSTLTFTWTVTGPGGFSETIPGRNVRFTPPDNGTYNATFTATDNGGLVASLVDQVMVANLGPEITRFKIPATGLRNRNVRLVGAASDPAGANDVLVYSWLITGPKKYRNVITGSTAVWKAPSVIGDYRVKLTVKDDDGGRDIAIGNIEIS